MERTPPTGQKQAVARSMGISLMLMGMMVSGILVHAPGEVPVGPGHPPYLTVFLIDGLSQAVFQEELAAGRLPNLSGLSSRGVYIENGIAAFPSMTGYGFYPFLTGRDAARSGILGLRWFDRNASHGLFHNYVGLTNVQMNEDITEGVPTLFECFPGQYTASINSYMNRGVHQPEKGGYSFFLAKHREFLFPNAPPGAVPGPIKDILPDWREAERRVMRLAMRQLEQRPKVHWITLAMPDAYQHLNGTRGEYRAIIREVDRLIGEYRVESARLGQEPSRIYAVLSDHGVADTRINLDLAQELEAMGLRATRDVASRFWNSTFAEPASTYAGLDAVVAVNGNKMGHVYFRLPGSSGSEKWRGRPDFEQLEAYPSSRGVLNIPHHLRNLSGVELVTGRGKGGVIRILGGSGESVIEEMCGGFRYRVVGKDPLGYATDPHVAPLLDARPHSGRAWLMATANSRYPDAVVRLFRLFESSACGDLVVVAAEDHDFGLDFEPLVLNYRGGHGGLDRDQLVVPYLLAGPGVRQGVRVPVARAEDVGATLFALLGVVQERGIEGRVLQEVLSTPGCRVR